MTQVKYLKDFVELMEEYDWDKNSEYDLAKLTYGSEKRIWWKCKEGHHWVSTPFLRTKGKGNCPTCAKKERLKQRNFQLANPIMSKAWHPTLNGEVTPDSITKNSPEKFYFQCQTCKHTWKAMAKSISCGSGCPFCARRKLGEHLRNVTRVYRPNNLMKTHPNWITLFDADKNAPLQIEEVTVNSKREVWWKCPACSKSKCMPPYKIVKNKKNQYCDDCLIDWT